MISAVSSFSPQILTPIYSLVPSSTCLFNSGVHVAVVEMCAQDEEADDNKSILHLNWLFFFIHINKHIRAQTTDHSNAYVCYITLQVQTYLDRAEDVTMLIKVQHTGVAK